MPLFNWFRKHKVQSSTREDINSASVPCTSAELIEIWRRIVIGDKKSWVLFENGTCVILMEPHADLRQQATDLLRVWGPVHVGTPSGDFTIVELGNEPGWVIGGHHNDILTYVGPQEFPKAKSPTAYVVGFFGRSKRAKDALELNIIHVEDKRDTAS